MSARPWLLQSPELINLKQFPVSALVFVKADGGDGGSDGGNGGGSGGEGKGDGGGGEGDGGGGDAPLSRPRQHMQPKKHRCASWP